MGLNSKIIEAMHTAGAVVKDVKKPGMTALINTTGAGIMKKSSDDLLSLVIAQGSIEDQAKSAGLVGLAPTLGSIAHHHADSNSFKTIGALIGGVGNVVASKSNQDPYGEGTTPKSMLGSFAEGALVGGISGHMAGKTQGVMAAKKIGGKFQAMADQAKGLKKHLGDLEDPTNKLNLFQDHVKGLKENGTFVQKGMAYLYSTDLAAHSFKTKKSLTDAHADIIGNYGTITHDFDKAHSAKVEALRGAYEKVKPFEEVHDKLHANGYKIGDVAAHLNAHGVAEPDILHHMTNPEITKPMQFAAESLAGQSYTTKSWRSQRSPQHVQETKNILDALHPNGSHNSSQSQL